MPADLLPHVFEMFTRGDPSTTGGQSGLGLGLTIADSIVAAHGGILTAHSPGPGQGSEFVVRLPLSRPYGVLGPLPTVSAPVVASPRILVVDDSEDTREILTVLLELEGYRVAAVSSGQEAVERAVRGEAEIVVIDIGLPDLDGSEVARRIRAARGNDVHIIALTGYGGREDSHRFMDAGFDAHLLKPVSTDELLRAVRSDAHRS
jgi:CheY-like chemotaxis protein